MLTRIYLLAVLLPVLFVGISYWPTEHFFTNQYDDSYITYRYAIQLAEGHGLVFNAGERTDAASSFLYTLVLSAAWLLGLHDLEIVGAMLGMASLALVCLYTYKLAYHLSANAPAAALASIACGLNGFLSGWTLSGMETLPWAASVLIAIHLIVTGAQGGAIVAAIGVAAFIRFEGIFLCMPYALMLLRRSSPWKGYLPLVGLSGLFALFYLIKFSYYEVWISHAFKMKELADYYQPAPQELFRNWMRWASLPVAMGLITLCRQAHLPILAYIGFSAISLTLGPKSDWSRYSTHLLPIFCAFASPALVWLATATSRPRLGQVACLALSALMLAQAVKGHIFNWKNMTALSQHQACRKQLGAYIDQHVPTDEYIASSDLGAIAYVALRHRFVDLIALTSSDVLRSYADGRNADAILSDKKVAYLADTFTDDDHDRVNTLLRQFPVIHERSGFAPAAGTPLFDCTANQALHFRLTRLNKSSAL